MPSGGSGPLLHRQQGHRPGADDPAAHHPQGLPGRHAGGGGVRRGRRRAHGGLPRHMAGYGAQGLSTLLLSVPGFWLALFLITVFAEWLHLLPTSGLDRGLASLVLPAVALSAANVGSTSRFTRGNILAQLGEQYIVVANAKGLSQRAVMVGHAFRNSLVPIITLIGNYFGGILGGSTIIENIFAIPGLGSYVLSAIQNRDYPVIQGYVLITGTTFVLVTLAIDLLYIAVNPKIRLQGERHDKTPETEHQAGPRVRHPGGHCPHDHLRPLAGPL
ncbi:MAG: ABC transporter permease [Flavonifractor plautii]